jgi:Tfp pilus assembly protein PilF
VGIADNLEGLLARGNDSAQLRFGLASAYVGSGEFERALTHAERAVEMQPDYSAAWRLLGQIHTALGRQREAMADFQTGIKIATRRGDKQLVKEMQVFLRRLRSQHEQD